jgi:hypothetical protein
LPKGVTLNFSGEYMANGKTVLIGSRLPFDLILRHPDKEVNATYTIKARHKTDSKTDDFATTEVDSDFWDIWSLANSDYEPLKKHAIFLAKGLDEARGKAKELRKEKTGFEPIKPADYNVQEVPKQDRK